MRTRWSIVAGILVVVGVAVTLVVAIPAQEQEGSIVPSGSLLETKDQADAKDTPSPDADPTLAVNDELQEEQWELSDPSLTPIPLEDADTLVIGIYSENLYVDDQRRQMVDLLEQDYASLSVIVTDEIGRPVVGIKPEFKVSGTSKLLPPSQVSARETTDVSGSLQFALIGGQMGLDRITISHGTTSVEVLVNVISLRAAGFPTPPIVDGVTPWDQLMRARISYADDKYSVNFPPQVEASSGKRVKLSGFMVPMDPELKQKRFLLTSNPPSCFFHVPGGPAGAVEVLASPGIEATWDPIVIEGRFEVLQTDEYDVIYRLHDATILKP